MKESGYWRASQPRPGWVSPPSSERMGVSLQGRAGSLHRSTPWSLKPALCPASRQPPARGSPGKGRFRGGGPPPALSLLPAQAWQTHHALAGPPPADSRPRLQAGPGCTWHSTRTRWRATCACSRRTWTCCTSTMSSECPAVHVAPSCPGASCPGLLSHADTVVCHLRGPAWHRLLRTHSGGHRPSEPACTAFARSSGLQLGSEFGALPLPDPSRASERTRMCSLCQGGGGIRVFIAAAASQLGLRLRPVSADAGGSWLCGSGPAGEAGRGGKLPPAGALSERGCHMSHFNTAACWQGRAALATGPAPPPSPPCLTGTPWSAATIT